MNIIETHSDICGTRKYFRERLFQKIAGTLLLFKNEQMSIGTNSDDFIVASAIPLQ